MEKIERDISNLSGEIARMCVNITNLTEHDSFFYYEADVNQISIYVHINGWGDNSKTQRHELYLFLMKKTYSGFDWESKYIKECKLKLTQLNKIKKELSKLIQI
ncbi:hypothetical protein [Frischella perrara]|uniref:hypothetical protein n=1 Tax=Frischella perrara TaxID=1267021 RepID=UPI0023F1F13F|nr:hypothetical protein [Frischella perrara]